MPETAEQDIGTGAERQGEETGGQTEAEFVQGVLQPWMERHADLAAPAGGSGRYGHVFSYVMNAPWALLPEKLDVILEVLGVRAAGGRFSPDEILLRTEAARQAERVEALAAAQRSGGAQAVAVIPVYGTIDQHAYAMQDTSGGVSTDRISGQLSQALANQEIGAIVLDVDSPGGSAYGIPELSRQIYEARAQKPVLAVANALAASAAYWLASAATELAVTPSGEVGSIGVYVVHEDYSEQLAADGVKVTVVKAGKYKAEANPWQPLEAEALAAQQGRVDGYYDMFLADVARNRGVKVADVRENFGEGRTVGAKEAVQRGMADRVATLQETIARAAQLARQNRRSARAEQDGRARAILAGL